VRKKAASLKTRLGTSSFGVLENLPMGDSLVHQEMQRRPNTPNRWWITFCSQFTKAGTEAFLLNLLKVFIIKTKIPRTENPQLSHQQLRPAVQS
jgi:hypothetical protein